MSWDAVVIGSGPEGLAASIVLARTGFRVLVAEEGPRVGGPIHAAEEFHPGFTAPGLPHEVPIDPAQAAALGLSRAGLTLTTPPAIRVGPHVLPGDPCAAAPELGQEWAAHRDWLHRIGGFVASTARKPPPPVDPRASLWPTLTTAFGARRLGAATLRTLLRRGPLSARDYLQEFFTDPAIVAGLAMGGLAGTRLGPLDPLGTPALLLRAATAAHEPVGGAAALVDVLAHCAEEAGVTVRTGVSVERVRVGPAQVDGVEIDGRMEDTRSVFVGGALSPVLGRWLDPFDIPPELDQDLGSWRARGAIAVVRLALAAPLSIGGSPVERLRTATDPMDLERARDAVKYRGVAESPPLDVRAWSTGAPPGQQVVTVHAHGVSVEGSRALDAGGRAALRDRVVAALDRAAPGTAASVVGAQLLTPADLEDRGVDGGHLWGGELAFDQLWITRPARRLSQYATPITGLYLCSGATHPAPFATCSSGVEAAAVAQGA